MRLSQYIGIAAVSVAFLAILFAIGAACVALFIESRRPYPDDKEPISGNPAGK